MAKKWPSTFSNPIPHMRKCHNPSGALDKTRTCNLLIHSQMVECREFNYNIRKVTRLKRVIERVVLHAPEPAQTHAM